jgi:hypothetical protein
MRNHLIGKKISHAGLRAEGEPRAKVSEYPGAIPEKAPPAFVWQTRVLDE